MVKFDTKTAHFGLMIQTMNIAKNAPNRIYIFQKFSMGDTLEPHFVLWTMIGHR